MAYKPHRLPRLTEDNQFSHADYAWRRQHAEWWRGFWAGVLVAAAVAAFIIAILQKVH